MDLVRSVAPKRAETGSETFAGLLSRELGPTLCQDFYFPYARKIWGLDPEQISPIQARRRVSAGSLSGILKRVVTGGARSPGEHGPRTFYYPRRGFGQISEALFDAAVSAGTRVALGRTVERIRRDPEEWQVHVRSAAGHETLTCDYVWSTIPIGTLVRIIDPSPPAQVIQSARSLKARAMLLVFLVLDTDRFTEFDAHYFPEPHVPFTRLSEPKNYSGEREPEGTTVLCAEVPCSRTDEVWSLDDAALCETVQSSLRKTGLPLTAPVRDVAVRRLTSAYPILEREFEAHFYRIDRWLDGLEGIVSFGRQGLFTHDNTHHALLTAMAAVRCLEEDGRFDRSRWAEYRESFTKHVVED